MKNNKAQDEAIRLAGGPVRILAGPGSGKTYTLVNHINYLINEQGVDPNKILVITFTKAAASEMQQRFQKLSNDFYSPVHFHTFHSLFYSFLKHSQSYSSFSVLTNQERIQIINHISNKLKTKFPNETSLKVDELSSFIAYKLNGGCEDRDEYPLGDKSKEFVMKEYISLLNKQGKLDFDDFANKVLEVFGAYPNYLNKIQSSYNYILVDEFQDINSVQYEAIKILAKPHGNLFIVGDISIVVKIRRIKRGAYYSCEKVA